ncbi:TPA: conjugal transfer protein, partial [Escherichia coli]
VPRSEFERRAKFNNDQTSPEAGVYDNESDHDKTVRFSSRPTHEQLNFDRNMDLTRSIPQEQRQLNLRPKLKLPGYKD